MANVIEESGPVVPQAFVDVHADLPEDMGRPRLKNGQMRDPSWASALATMDDHDGQLAFPARKLAGDQQSAIGVPSVAVRSLTELPTEPAVKKGPGIVAWVIGSMAAIAILFVIASILLRVVRAVWKSRSRAASEVQRDAPEDVIVSLSKTRSHVENAENAPNDVTAISNSPVEPAIAPGRTTRFGRFTSKLRRRRNAVRTVPATGIENSVPMSASETALPALAQRVGERVENSPGTDKPADSRRVRKTEHRGQNRMKREVTPPPATASHVAPPVLTAVDEKSLPAVSGGGAFARALASLQSRSLGNGRPALR
ncbi:MAG: hypothetical protein AB7O26_14375 [Planctomycetaceae bacterium]